MLLCLLSVALAASEVERLPLDNAAGGVAEDGGGAGGEEGGAGGGGFGAMSALCPLDDEHLPQEMECLWQKKVRAR